MLAPKGEFYNYSGCGNTFNCNNPIVRQFILDCLRYWVTEMHVDGFRFDLASILTRSSSSWNAVNVYGNSIGGDVITTGTPLTSPPLIDMISNDPILRGVKEGEFASIFVKKLRKRQMRNFFFCLMVSQGVPMIYMGDEYGHIKGGNNNTYCHDNYVLLYFWASFLRLSPPRFSEAIGEDVHEFLTICCEQLYTYFGFKLDGPGVIITICSEISSPLAKLVRRITCLIIPLLTSYTVLIILRSFKKENIYFSF